MVLMLFINGNTLSDKSLDTYQITAFSIITEGVSNPALSSPGSTPDAMDITLGLVR
jgi:hypothetical protein